MSSTSNQSDPSFSSSSPGWPVFLSYHVEDTQKTFIGHLYGALDQAGIQTFKDDPELPRGEEISAKSQKAIQDSTVSMIVFSRNYASSSWCLEELVEILECKRTKGHAVFPIFYDVEPMVVCYQTDSFAEAFKSHVKRDTDKVERWKAALTEAGSLSGYNLQNDANGCVIVLILLLLLLLMLLV